MSTGTPKPLILLAGFLALFFLLASAFVCVVVSRLSLGRPGGNDGPNVSATLQPSRVPSVQPSSTKATVDSIRDSLNKGNIAFNKPSAMVLDETKDVQLLLSPSVSAEDLKKLVTGEGEVQTNEVSVSDYMEARLSGDNFVISDASQRKLVSTKGTTEWHWDVTPTKAGRQRLHLTLSAIVNYRDGEKLLELKTFHEVIEVNVSASQRFYAFANVLGTHLSWIAPSLLIPMALWGWNRWKKRKKAAVLSEKDEADTARSGDAGPGPTKRTGRSGKNPKPPKTPD